MPACISHPQGISLFILFFRRPVLSTLHCKSTCSCSISSQSGEHVISKFFSTLVRIETTIESNIISCLPQTEISDLHIFLIGFCSARKTRHKAAWYLSFDFELDYSLKCDWVAEIEVEVTSFAGKLDFDCTYTRYLYKDITGPVTAEGGTSLHRCRCASWTITAWMQCVWKLS